MKNVVFWDVALYRTSWFTARGYFYPEDGGDTFLRNVGWWKIYTAPHPRKRHSWYYNCGSSRLKCVTLSFTLSFLDISVSKCNLLLYPNSRCMFASCIAPQNSGRWLTTSRSCHVTLFFPRVLYCSFTFVRIYTPISLAFAMEQLRTDMFCTQT
jgi:hypothetical protein